MTVLTIILNLVVWPFLCYMWYKIGKSKNELALKSKTAILDLTIELSVNAIQALTKEIQELQAKTLTVKSDKKTNKIKIKK